jgi:protein-disulfide isomerase
MKAYVTTLGLISSTLFMSAFAATNNDAAPSGTAVVAEIDGTKLTLAEFERKRPAGLFQAKNTFYESERKAVEDYIYEYLLERQAQKENLTIKELLDKHVYNALPKDPPEEALRVYYEGVDTTEPYEAVRSQILDNVRQRRMTKAKNAYLLGLRNAAKVSIRIDPPRAELALKDTPLRGPQNAQVMLVEFADYECAYCQQIQPALDKLEAQYKGKIAFAYKDFPLPMHTNAAKASEAAHCAGAQGKYWEYHDMLYATKQLAVPQLKEGARALKLDGQAFDKCLDSGSKIETVRTHFNEGQGFALDGTPSFFINGRFFKGALTYDQLKAIVDEELGSSRNKETAQR